MRPILSVLLLLGTLQVGAVQAGAESGSWPPFYELADSGLQARLDRLIANRPEWRRLAADHRLAVGLVDLSAAEPRFAAANGEVMMYAASLPKIAILFAAYVSLADGSLPDRPEIRQDMSDMIRHSSNAASNRLIDLIGMQRIQTLLRDPRFAFYDASRGGGLWIGKRFAKGTPRLPDPIHGLSHGATVTQVCRFYYLLAADRLLSSEWNHAMLEDLSRPGLHHKFMQPLAEQEAHAAIYRKSGTWRRWHSDSVWVRGSNWRNYILAALVESNDGEQILRDLLPAIETLLRPAPAD